MEGKSKHTHSQIEQYIFIWCLTVGVGDNSWHLGGSWLLACGGGMLYHLDLVKLYHPISLVSTKWLCDPQKQGS